MKYRQKKKDQEEAFQILTVLQWLQWPVNLERAVAKSGNIQTYITIRTGCSWLVAATYWTGSGYIEIFITEGNRKSSVLAFFFKMCDYLV